MVDVKRATVGYQVTVVITKIELVTTIPDRYDTSKAVFNETVKTGIVDTSVNRESLPECVSIVDAVLSTVTGIETRPKQLDAEERAKSAADRAFSA